MVVPVVSHLGFVLFDEDDEQLICQKLSGTLPGDGPVWLVELLEGRIVYEGAERPWGSTVPPRPWLPDSWDPAVEPLRMLWERNALARALRAQPGVLWGQALQDRLRRREHKDPYGTDQADRDRGILNAVWAHFKGVDVQDAFYYAYFTDAEHAYYPHVSERTLSGVPHDTGREAHVSAETLARELSMIDPPRVLQATDAWQVHRELDVLVEEEADRVAEHVAQLLVS